MSHVQVERGYLVAHMVEIIRSTCVVLLEPALSESKFYRRLVSAGT
jgi:hypothetical protein